MQKTHQAFSHNGSLVCCRSRATHRHSALTNDRVCVGGGGCTGCSMHHISLTLKRTKVSLMHTAHSPDSMRRSIIWTSPTQAAAWSGVRRSWSCGINIWSTRRMTAFHFSGLKEITWYTSFMIWACFSVKVNLHLTYQCIDILLFVQ